MGAWDRILHGGELASFGGFGVITAAVLILATWALMPRTDRKKLRLPIALLALNLVAVALRTVLSEDSAAQKPLHVIAVFFLLSCIGRTGFLLTVDWLLGTRLKQPLSKIFRDIIQVLVFVAVALLTLRSMGLEPGSLLTTSALLTAVIGLSLQETLGNLFAGLAIQAQRPFSVGDWISSRTTLRSWGGSPRSTGVRPRCSPTTWSRWWCPTASWPRRPSATTRSPPA